MIETAKELAEKLGFQPRLWIGGGWEDAKDGRMFTVMNPAEGSVIREVALAEAEAGAAVEAATLALGSWSRTPAIRRADTLMQIARLISENREALARLATMEQGAPLEQSRGGVDYAVSFFRWFAEEARRIYGRTIQHPDPRRLLRTEYAPIGVVGVITPWNGPLAGQEGGSRAGSGLHRGAEALRANPSVRPGTGIAERGSRSAPRSAECRLW